MEEKYRWIQPVGVATKFWQGKRWRAASVLWSQRRRHEVLTGRRGRGGGRIQVPQTSISKLKFLVVFLSFYFEDV